jgi:aryl-alcohol dehydrogenase-like predicted oxidoreductase
MSSKIIIGTANFGQNYGISKKKVNLRSAKVVCGYAIENKIRYLDTATSYKNSNKIIKILNKKIEVITKVLPCKKWINFDYCLNEMNKIYFDLGNKKINTLLFHDKNFLFKKEGYQVYLNLIKLKKKKLFKNIGVSIYNFYNLNYLIKKYSFDIIQCPFNIFDQRLIETNWLSKLKNRGIKIHVRSIFLQGLLLNKNLNNNNISKKWKKDLMYFNEYANKNNINLIDLCMTFVTSYNLNGYVIGIENLKNLKKIIFFKKVKKFNFKMFSNNKKKLIDPRKWK